MSSFNTIELSDSSYERDGLRFLTAKTDNLQGRGDICIYVPEVAKDISNLPIYILLHGVYGSSWVWAYKGGAHITAHRLIANQEIEPAIIAMPSDGLWGDGSAYFTHHQKQFDQWIVNDVRTAIIENIPASGAKSKLCIGGLSMGGYGALMLGGRFPEKFAAISGHSSITKLEQVKQFVEEPIEAYTNAAEIPDVIDAMIKNSDRLPVLRFDCGIDDPLIDANRILHDQLLESHIRHEYEEFPGGHEWSYWQQHVERTFRFFDRIIKRSNVVDAI
ncbi:MAG: putative tributyrin esterase [Saprospiraceae bacterium]|jgi:putative tributyrin esterase